MSHLYVITYKTIKRPYFDMNLQTLNGKRGAVCFSKDRYIIFKELDESGEQGCMITSYDTNDNDILINDCTKVSKIVLDFNKAKETVYSDIKSVINEFSLYTRVNIKGKITDLSVATENDVGGTIFYLSLVKYSKKLFSI